jgi:enoyl-CoA hydratase/carnithine racemase
MTEPVRRHDQNGITTLTLSAPETLNALSTAMLAALAAELDALAADDRVRVVILAAEGKAFSAGQTCARCRRCAMRPTRGARAFRRCSTAAPG